MFIFHHLRSPLSHKVQIKSEVLQSYAFPRAQSLFEAEEDRRKWITIFDYALNTHVTAH
jgi:hypothetical protein